MTWIFTGDNDRAGRNNTTVTNSNTAKNETSGTNPATISYNDWFGKSFTSPPFRIA
jgi:hypothetical protein